MRWGAKQMKWLLAIVFMLCMAYIWLYAPLTLFIRLATTVSGALIVITAILAAKD